MNDHSNITTMAANDRLSNEYPKNGDLLQQHVKFPFSGLEANNPFLKAAMTERLATWDDSDHSKRGIPTPELIRAYEEWGKGGFGVILSGNTFGQFQYLEAKRNPIMAGNEPERMEAFKKMAKAAKAHGSLYIVQLSHGGRQVPAEITAYPVAASEARLTHMSGNDVTSNFGQPNALDQEGINTVIREFADAAKYAYDSGADGVQLHGAHGYLLSGFLSPSTNNRTDKYGGSLENRSRIIMEILDAVRAKVSDPKFLLGIKLNSVEFQQGGFGPEECRDVCTKLEEKSVDFIELSGGSYESLAFQHRRESTVKRESFFLEWSDIVRQGVKKAQIYVTGGFRTAKAMADALEARSCVGIGLARPVCQEFDLPKQILEKKVASSRKSIIGEDNFLMANAVCCYQIKQVGEGHKPVDTLDKAALDPVLKELGLA